MTIDVKICGLSDPAGVAAAVEAGADMIGFVFFPPSPRHVPVAEAARLAAPARGRANIVALTVDADDNALSEIAEGLKPDLIQLHGSETPERTGDIAARFAPVMKALGVSRAEDVAAAAAYLPHVERVLFDAKPPEGATRPGGLGRSFDWSLVAGLDLPVPCMLSGGLDPDSVAEALETVRPAGVDVSSGVESARGVKDPVLIRHFIDRVRALDAAFSVDLERMTS